MSEASDTTTSSSDRATRITGGISAETAQQRKRRDSSSSSSSVLTQSFSSSSVVPLGSTTKTTSSVSVTGGVAEVGKHHSHHSSSKSIWNKYGSVRLKACLLFFVSLLLIQGLIILLTLFAIWPRYETSDLNAGGTRGVSMALFMMGIMQSMAKRVDNSLKANPPQPAIGYYLATGNRTYLDLYTMGGFGVAGVNAVSPTAFFKTRMGLDYVGIFDRAGNILFQAASANHTGSMMDDIGPFRNFTGVSTFGGWKSMMAVSKTIGELGSFVIGRIMSETAPPQMAEFIGMCVTMLDPQDPRGADMQEAEENLKDHQATQAVAGWTKTDIFQAKIWYDHTLPIYSDKRICPTNDPDPDDKSVQATYVSIKNGPLIRVDRQLIAYESAKTESLKLLAVCSAFIWLMFFSLLAFSEICITRRALMLLPELAPDEFKDKSTLHLMASTLCGQDEISMMRTLVKNKLRTFKESLETTYSALHEEEAKAATLENALRVLNIYAGRKCLPNDSSTLSTKGQELSLEEILPSPFFVEVFKNFCMDEQSSESLFFLLDVFDLVTEQDKVRGQQSPEILKKMEAIYSYYLDPKTAVKPLNLSSATSRKTVQKFKAWKAGEPLPNDLYDQAASEIAQMLKGDTLKRFYLDSSGQMRCRTMARMSEVLLSNTATSKAKTKKEKGIKYFFKRVFGDALAEVVQQLQLVIANKGQSQQESKMAIFLPRKF